MTKRTLPNIGLTNNWTQGAPGWNEGMDANLAAIDALLHLTVVSASLREPPVSASQGERYIVPAGATGGWAGRDGQVAVMLDGQWQFYRPKNGVRAWSLEVASDMMTLNGRWRRMTGGGTSLSSMTAGGMVSGQRALMASIDGMGVVHADPLSGDYQFAGLSTQASLPGGTLLVAYAGRVEEPTWDWTPRLPIFTGAEGRPTQTPPVAGILQQIGTAMSRTAMLVQPFAPVIRN